MGAPLGPRARAAIGQLGQSVSRLLATPRERGLLVLIGGLVPLGFIPLFGGLSYEAALATGLWVPGIAAVTTALAVRRSEQPPLLAFRQGLATGVLYALVAILISAVHGLHAGLCAPWAGLSLMALGPGLGAVLGGAFGALVGLLLRRIGWQRRSITIFAALLGPVSSALVSVWRFYDSPIVFAYDPFVGYFAGPIYETVLRGTSVLLTYRAGTLCTLLAAYAWLACTERRAQSSVQGRTWWALLAASGTAASLSLISAGPTLGHYQTTESIREALGRTHTGQRCEVVHSRWVSPEAASLLARECEQHVTALERYFGAAPGPRIAVFLFASGAEKGWLMGASRTLIAKPWRNEVYIQASGFPHPVLGHELAHVVAGRFARGPFRVGGAWGGLWPDPGRIEGYAVAASPPEESELTLLEWAQAMRVLGLLPPLESIFHLGFLGQPASTAYTVAGAFISWLHQEQGADKLRRFYAGESFERVYGEPLSAMERRWHGALDGIALMPTALEAARARFDRKGMFARACPHEVDALRAEADQLLSAGDARGAKELYEALLRLDSAQASVRMAIGICAERLGDVHSAEQQLKGVAEDTRWHQLERLSAREARADLLLRSGRTGEAHEEYEKIAALVLDANQLRTLEVKRSAEDGLAREAVVSLLLGAGSRGPSWDLAAAALGRWLEAEPENGLSPYLLARNLYGRGFLAEADRYLQLALSRKLELPRVEKEAERLHVVLACAAADTPRVQRAAALYLARADLTLAERSSLERLRSRCAD